MSQNSDHTHEQQHVIYKRDSTSTLYGVDYIERAAKAAIIKCE